MQYIGMINNNVMSLYIVSIVTNKLVVLSVEINITKLIHLLLFGYSYVIVITSNCENR